MWCLSTLNIEHNQLDLSVAFCHFFPSKSEKEGEKNEEELNKRILNIVYHFLWEFFLFGTNLIHPHKKIQWTIKGQQGPMSAVYTAVIQSTWEVFVFFCLFPVSPHSQDIHCCWSLSGGDGKYFCMSVYVTNHRHQLRMPSPGRCTFLCRPFLLAGLESSALSVVR